MKIKPPIRGFDVHGSGAFQAPRGNHTHNGIDFACIKGSSILSVCSGKVTKIGYPYDPANQVKGHLRYVQVTDIDGLDHRYFYISPSVEVGDKVRPSDVLGVSQGLTEIYKGITDHFHYEIKENGAIIDPNDYLGE